ncbi:MAG: exodeoxyribonuclease VII small subunit [Eubacterium sp.]|nr:exodeoxyribonuclease VII small subunit [Eubacterium sp.]
MAEKKKKTSEEFSIEDAMKRIEEINTLLQDKGTSLKDSLALYKEGVELSEKCRKNLEDVEKEIIILSENE